jgi:hypothetical protein
VAEAEDDADALALPPLDLALADALDSALALPPLLTALDLASALACTKDETVTKRITRFRLYV